MQAALQTTATDPAAKLWTDYEAVYTRLSAHHALHGTIDPAYIEKEHDAGQAAISALALTQPTTLVGIAACLAAAQELAGEVRDWLDDDLDGQRQCHAIACIENALAALVAMGVAIPS